MSECVRSFGAPGAVNFEAEIGACADSLGAARCASELPASCQGRGALESGARCIGGFQCKSGLCQGGGVGESCGVCAEPVPPGTPCASSEACGDGACCAYGPEGAGKCQPIGTVKLGERCDASTVRCEDGLLCNMQQLCVEPGPIGAACERTRDCADTLRCQNNRCAAALGAGAPCWPSEDACGPGLGCAPGGTCAPILFVLRGEMCDGSRRCEAGECRGDSYGEDGKRIAMGRCVDFLADGAECGRTGQESQCQEPARCIAGRCALRDYSACR